MASARERAQRDADRLVRRARLLQQADLPPDAREVAETLLEDGWDRSFGELLDVARVI